MKKHYFIDYENVRENGLDGLSSLDSDCYVHLLFTRNANKISLDSLINTNGAHVEIIKTPAGKQSLDMQLVSYLGYILGRESGEECFYYIVSKDKGYKNTEQFWAMIPEAGGRVKMCAKISETAEIAAKEPAVQKNDEREGGAEVPPEVESSAAAEPEIEPSEETQPQENKNQPAKRNRRGGRKTQARKEQENPSEAAEGQDKPADTPEQQENRDSQSDEKKRRELNSRLMKALSETGMDNKMVGQIASLCVKHSGKENRRQLIYRGIISKLGQKNGLETYRIIKGII